MMTRARIMVAPNGARRTKADHPALPMTLDEIVSAAVACAAAGADALHLHIRDEKGGHSLDAGRYREALDAIAAAAPTLELQITTEAVGIYRSADLLACLQSVEPRWASVNVRELDDATAKHFYAFAAETGTRIQSILHDANDAALFRARREAGVVRAEQDEALLVLGSYRDQRPGDPEELDPLLDALGPGYRWSICAFGPSEQACLLHAAARGASSLRVGFENNVHHPDGRLWRDNAEAVATLLAALETEHLTEKRETR